MTWATPRPTSAITLTMREMLPAQHPHSSMMSSWYWMQYTLSVHPVLFMSSSVTCRKMRRRLEQVSKHAVNLRAVHVIQGHLQEEGAGGSLQASDLFWSTGAVHAIQSALQVGCNAGEINS